MKTNGQNFYFSSIYLTKSDMRGFELTFEICFLFEHHREKRWEGALLNAMSMSWLQPVAAVRDQS
jgi:hypothetical protein